MSGILVVAEVFDGELQPISHELLGAARKLSADGAGDVSAFVAGETHAQDLIAHGADTVYAGTSESLQTGLPHAYRDPVNAAIEQSGADIVLLGQTTIGRDLGPMLAYINKTAVSMETVDLQLQDGRLRGTRSCYGGNARAELTWKQPLQIATVKGKSFDPLEPDSSRSGETKTIDAETDTRIEVLSTEKAEATGVRLEDAPVVVSGGRGLGDPSAFGMLEELSGLLKGATGASRAACDLGWYPPSQQVGLTGKVVSPNVYIAVAISGASQHMAGMASSKNIVAINKDADANMVKVAKFAIVDDYKKVIPALIEEIKKAK